MADLNTPGVAPAGAAPSRAALPDDDFSRRMGIAVAASLGINFLLFQGAGMLAQAMQRAPEFIQKIEVALKPKTEITPLPATPAPTPSALPSVASATPAPATPIPATPVPATPKPVESSPVATPRPATPVPATPAPATPVPATPKPVTNLTQKSVTTAATVAAAATAAAAAATLNQPRNQVANRANDAKPADIKNTTLTTQQTNSSVAAVNPDSRRQLNTFRGDAKATPVKTAATSFSAKNSSSASANPNVTSISSANSSRNTAVTGRNAATNVAIGQTALNPVVVQPEARSTFAGEQRQLKTVAGAASTAKGRTSVVTLSSKAADASPASFTVATGGQLKAGQATARQGGAGTNAVALVAGAPTAISTGGEYAVYAPVPATRGIIGIRGDSHAKIGGTVTNLQAKGNIGEVAAGTAVYAAAPSGKAASAGQARVAAQQAGISGTLSAQPGAGVGAGVVQGEARGSESTGVKGAANGAGPPARGKQNEAGGGVGGKQGGIGGIAGAGTAGAVGPIKGGQVGAKTAASGSVGTQGDKNLKANTEATEKVTTTGAAPIKKDIVKIDTNIEQEQLASEKNVAQIAARATSKPEFDLPEGLRSQRVDKTVVAKVTVEADGSHDESIVEGSGNSELDSAVKAWLHRWRWEAAKQEGKPVKSSFKINVPVKVN